MQTRAANVFISYSHADAGFVAPVVALLRATRAVVFRDADTIRPGKRWREEIDLAIQQSDLVVVFWCQHSGASAEVGNEYERALALRKDVLPVLLDGSPLPSSLSPFQHIDFQEMARPSHGHSATAAPPPRSIHARSTSVALMAAVIAMVFGAAWTLNRGSGHPPGSAGAPGGALTALMALAVALMTIGGLIWAARRRKHHDGRIATSEPTAAPDEAQRNLASTLQTELVERLRSRGMAAGA